MARMNRKMRRMAAKKGQEGRVGATAPKIPPIEERLPEKDEMFGIFGHGFRVPGLYRLADGPASPIAGEIKIQVVTPEEFLERNKVAKIGVGHGRKE